MLRILLQDIVCRAAIAWEAEKPLDVVDITVAPPQVRHAVGVLPTRDCQSDCHADTGAADCCSAARMLVWRVKWRVRDR